MKKYKLENDEVLVEFLDCGGAITKLFKKSTATNYVLAYDDERHYEDNPYFLDTTIGRVAGRTFPPRYQNHQGKPVTLDVNEGDLHLHGGITFEMERQPNYLHEDRDVLDKDYFAVTSYEII